jgi:hypothetical protein
LCLRKIRKADSWGKHRFPKIFLKIPCAREARRKIIKFPKICSVLRRSRLPTTIPYPRGHMKHVKSLIKRCPHFDEARGTRAAKCSVVKITRVCRAALCPVPCSCVHVMADACAPARPHVCVTVHTHWQPAMRAQGPGQLASLCRLGSRDCQCGEISRKYSVRTPEISSK